MARRRSRRPGCRRRTNASRRSSGSTASDSPARSPRSPGRRSTRIGPRPIDKRSGEIYEQLNHVPSPAPRRARARRRDRGARAAVGDRDLEPEGPGGDVGRGPGPRVGAHDRRREPRRARQARAGPPAPGRRGRRASSPTRCWYIGDSTWDMVAAVAAGMIPIGVTAGAAVDDGGAARRRRRRRGRDPDRARRVARATLSRGRHPARTRSRRPRRGRLAAAVRSLAAIDPDLAGIAERHGPPPLWAREPGFETLVRIILEQQISLASAEAAFRRLVPGDGPGGTGRDRRRRGGGLRAAGQTRQKARYLVGLARDVLDGRLDLDAVAAADDDDARAMLTSVVGIGRWTADIYLLMALRRPDVWPTGDLALAGAMRRAKGMAALPTGAGAGGGRRGVAALAGRRRAPALARVSRRGAVRTPNSRRAGPPSSALRPSASRDGLASGTPSRRWSGPGGPWPRRWSRTRRGPRCPPCRSAGSPRC